MRSRFLTLECPLKTLLGLYMRFGGQHSWNLCRVFFFTLFSSVLQCEFIYSEQLGRITSIPVHNLGHSRNICIY